ncbi:hypothetical protein Rhopal_001423-T1 [Rhodotorula paludigena]|uniref:EH domain-containing protein n=1 Tax=Rhodotorula paludigena TaxID=86838 RepID=A0AAV5GGF1_9BASI|nr:hypothetical protein Rhopal_001423-T1 [Rhodotorula paludigena]
MWPRLRSVHHQSGTLAALDPTASLHYHTERHYFPRRQHGFPFRARLESDDARPAQRRARDRVQARLSSAYPSLSRASTQRQPARRPQVSSDSVPDASPARKADGADPDAGAQRRYLRVFEQCCAATRAGVGPQPGSGDEKTLAAPVVAELWRRSRLPDHELREIWDGVAGSQAGLTAEQFVAGMWAIDEELRRRQKKGR